MAWANIIGITPAAYGLSGIYWRFENILLWPIPTDLLAYWTGICLTARTNRIHNAITTTQITNSIAIINKPPLPDNWEINSWANERGSDAIIPTVINKEIPLPIPLSVIFSPNHIAKTQPVTNIITAGIINETPFPKTNAASGTPRAPKPYKYAGAWTTQIAIVNQRVIWVIFFLPLSPSFCNFWRYGTATPINWTTIDADM